MSARAVYRSARHGFALVLVHKWYMAGPGAGAADPARLGGVSGSGWRAPNPPLTSGSGQFRLLARTAPGRQGFLGVALGGRPGSGGPRPPGPASNAEPRPR